MIKVLAAGLVVISASVFQAVAQDAARETRQIASWTVHISRELLTQQAKETARALELLEKQLQEISCAVPASAVAELRKVPLWFRRSIPASNRAPS